MTEVEMGSCDSIAESLPSPNELLRQMRQRSYEDNLKTRNCIM